MRPSSLARRRCRRAPAAWPARPTAQLRALQRTRDTRRTGTDLLTRSVSRYRLLRGICVAAISCPAGLLPGLRDCSTDPWGHVTGTSYFLPARNGVLHPEVVRK